MKLLYLYVYDSSLQDIELNFSVDRIFHFEKNVNDNTNKIIVTKRDKSVSKDYWGDNPIYNVTALVGDNGSGKTTLMHYIMRAILNEQTQPNKDSLLPAFSYLILWEDKESHIFFSSNLLNCDSFTLCENEEQVTINKKLVDDIFGIKLCYISNGLSLSDAELFESARKSIDNYFERNKLQIDTDKNYNKLFFYNCSLLSCMYHSLWSRRTNNTDNLSIIDRFLTHYNYEAYREIRYIYGRKYRDGLITLKKKNVPVPIPEKLYIIIDLPDYGDVVHDNSLWGDCLESTVAIKISICCLQNCFMRFEGKKKKDYYLDNEESKELRRNFFESLNAKTIDDLNIMENYISWLRKKEKEKNIDVNNYIKFISFVWTNEEAFGKFFNLESANKYFVYTDENSENFLEEFFQWVKIISDNNYFITTNWGLSSGESNLLRLFTKIHCAINTPGFLDEKYTGKYDEYPCHINEQLASHGKDKIVNIINNADTTKQYEKKCDTFLLFIDEADLTFHPEWQRKYIWILTEFLASITKECELNDIQIILNTHSPLMLGDLPESSVIYLKRGKSNSIEVDTIPHQTLGQNLYSILKEGFYLDSPLGAMVQNKINDILHLTDRIIKNNGASDDIITEEEYKKLCDFECAILPQIGDSMLRNGIQKEISTAKRILGDSFAKITKEKKLQILMAEHRKLENEIESLKNEIKTDD